MEQLFVDSNCIEYMIQEFSDMLVRIAYQNLNNPSDAEDIAQEVFLKCIKANVTFKDHQHMKAWLIRVTINQCKDHNKSAWFQKNTRLVEDTIVFPTIETKVLEELEQLPIHYRNIIYLYYYEEYTLAEIAKILHKSINTISSQLQRSRKKLKSIILEGGERNE